MNHVIRQKIQFSDWAISTHGMTKLCLSLLVIFLCSCQQSVVKPTPSPLPSPPPASVPDESATEVEEDEPPVSDTQKREPEWMAKVVLGKRAEKSKQWRQAARYYNEALDLIDNPTATPQAPSPAEIKRVYEQATKAQLIADTLAPLPPMRLSLQNAKCSSTMRSRVRGIRMTKHLKAVQFEFDQTTFTAVGKQAAQQLSVCLKERGFSNISQVTLIGHTDEKGTREYNQDLSKKRANVLKNYLILQAITAKISTAGRGEDEPVHLDNPEDFTQEEIYALNRRVEIITDE